jgi:nicotinate-nucleotide adenylyltransferase
MPLPMAGAVVDRGVGGVVIFGGSFDPPHRGHVRLGTAARDAWEEASGLRGVWLVCVPAARSPHKQLGPIADGAYRAEMLRLALAGEPGNGGVPRAGVWTDELDRAGGASYTVETLRRARAWLDARGGRGVPLRLLIGADQALAFHTWREPAEILRLAPPLVLLRSAGSGSGGADATSLIADLHATGAWNADQLETWRGGIVQAPLVDISATAVRAALREPKRDPAALEAMVGSPVLRYIESHGLYIA